MKSTHGREADLLFNFVSAWTNISTEQMNLQHSQVHYCHYSNTLYGEPRAD
jgi:hypothetical protein